MAAWAPQPEGLHTIVQLLTEYRQPGANQAQARPRSRPHGDAGASPAVSATDLRSPGAVQRSARLQQLPGLRAQPRHGTPQPCQPRQMPWLTPCCFAGPAAGGAPKRGPAAEEQRPSRLEIAQPGRASLRQGTTLRPPPRRRPSLTPGSTHRKACCRAWASRSATCASPSAPPSGAPRPPPPPLRSLRSPNTLLSAPAPSPPAAA